MSLLDALHGRYVFGRRVERIAGHLAALIPEGGAVLDVGCGDGTVGRSVMELRPDLSVRGVEVALRDETHLPVALFDGETLPYEDHDFDTVLFVDVLHHLEEPSILLREGARVARRAVVIKDHVREGFLAASTLRLMDWVGNARYGIPLPNTYWSLDEWEKALEGAGLTVAEWRDSLKLYPPPASWLFDRSLHFVARLAPDGSSFADDPVETES